MGTDEKLVPGELLTINIICLFKLEAKQNFKIKFQSINNGLTHNINEEMTHV
jgi:hypothetical protein